MGAYNPGVPAALLAAALLTRGGTIFASPLGHLGLAIGGGAKTPKARLWGHDEKGREVTLWSRPIPAIPGDALVSDGGQVALVDASYSGGDHAVMIFSPEGRLLADYKLSQILTPAELARLKRPQEGEPAPIYSWRSSGLPLDFVAPENYALGTKYRTLKGVPLFGSVAELFAVPTAFGRTAYFNVLDGKPGTTDAAGRPEPPE